jgi:hypothetical protein
MRFFVGVPGRTDDQDGGIRYSVMERNGTAFIAFRTTIGEHQAWRFSGPRQQEASLTPPQWRAAIFAKSWRAVA